MLVLARKKNESIVIGDGIEITVLKVKGNTVRIGINAPSDVKILRGELAPFGVEIENGAAQETKAETGSPMGGAIIDSSASAPLRQIVIAQAS